MKRLRALLLSVVLALALIPTMPVQAFEIVELKTHYCDSYNKVANRQLSGVLNNLTTSTVYTNSDDLLTDYYYKFTVKGDSYASVYLKFKDKLYTDYSITLYRNAAFETPLAGSGETFTAAQPSYNKMWQLAPGTYYLKLQLIYKANLAPVYKETKEIIDITYDSNGNKVENRRIEETGKVLSTDVNCTVSNTNVISIKNQIQIGIAYTDISKLCTTKITYLNNVATVTVDASKLFPTSGSTFSVQMREGVYDASSATNRNVWVMENSTADALTNVKTLLGTGTKKKVVTYIRETGNYTFRINLPDAKTTEDAIFLTVFCDCDSPVVTLKSDSKSYVNEETVRTFTKPVTIQFKDADSKIKVAKLNGETIAKGTKVSTNGTYTLKVKDTNGNLTKIKFKVKIPEAKK